MSPTPLRNVRAAQEWDLAMRRAESEGYSLSEVIRGWLREYGTHGAERGPVPLAATPTEELQ